MEITDKAPGIILSPKTKSYQALPEEEKAVACPNCGCNVKQNYCPGCGQQKRLHDDNFLSLLAHTFAHYFHYESKFWLTLRTLLFSPGALTLAYFRKQRARYVAPVSLYIFVSVLFFLLNAGIEKAYTKAGFITAQTHLEAETIDLSEKIANSTNAFQREYYKIFNSLDDKRVEEVNNLVPKISFLMIPVLALLLQLFFVSRKDLSFVQHAVFSMHYQTVIFIMLVFAAVMDFSATVTSIFDPIAVALLLIYFVVALRKTYQVSVKKATAVSVVVIPLYFVSMIVFMFIVSAFFFYF